MEREISSFGFFGIREKNNPIGAGKNTLSDAITRKQFVRYLTQKFMSRFRPTDTNEELFSELYGFADILVHLWSKTGTEYIFVEISIVIKELFYDDIDYGGEFFDRMSANTKLFKKHFGYDHIKKLMMCDEKITKKILSTHIFGGIFMFTALCELFMEGNDELFVKFCQFTNSDLNYVDKLLVEQFTEKRYPRRIANIRKMLGIN